MFLASKYRYRWTGRENDDDGNFKIPAEAFEAMEPADLTPVDAANKFLLAPKDRDFFVWQKSASEFKNCIEENIKEKRTHPKGRRLTDTKKIEAYMTRCC